MKYFEGFESVDDIREEFTDYNGNGPDGLLALKDEDVLFACYSGEGYEGYAVVIFKGEDGKLYEVEGSHCSCNGLEDQWLPGEVTWESLKLRLTDRFYEGGGFLWAAPVEAKSYFENLVLSNCQNADKAPLSVDDLASEARKMLIKARIEHGALMSEQLALEAKINETAQLIGRLAKMLGEEA